MVNSYIYETPLGKISISENGQAVTALNFLEDTAPLDAQAKETPLLAKTAKQLNEYLSGNRQEFTIPLNPSGTEFQIKVWKVLTSIPYGETLSYKQVAIKAGNPKACRAVGMANNRNPIPVIIPCHRVIGANGKLVGYGGGLPKKIQLLNLEKCLFKE